MPGEHNTPSDKARVVAGIEAGGTSFRCAIADTTLNILDRIELPTTTPEETLAGVCEFLNQHRFAAPFAAPLAAPFAAPFAAIGLACFGPVEINPSAPEYGSLLDTPKQDWQGYNILAAIKQQIDAPVALTTDVTAPALLEATSAELGPQDTLAYITTGTGIGGACVQAGVTLNPGQHAEMGHISVARHPDDTFGGVCPFHGDCLEGMANAQAIKERWQAEPETLPDDHDAWDLQAYYLAQLCTNLIRIVTPSRILIGGGLAKPRGLIQKIRAATETRLGDYHMPQTPLDQMIQSPMHGDDAGLLGALWIACRMLEAKAHA